MEFILKGISGRYGHGVTISGVYWDVQYRIMALSIQPKIKKNSKVSIAISQSVD